MDLCLMIEGQEGVTWPQWVAIARACEQHGIPALFRSDHYLNLEGHGDRGALDAWATISALAAVTTTLRLGTLVSPATFRHPVVLAKMVATADLVSDGRVELGLGAGWHEREHAACGFAFPPLGARMAMLAEQLEIVHRAWGPEAFSFSGEHYSIDDLDAMPKPGAAPHPPLLMGGIAGPRGAALAARWADEYNTVFATVDECVARRDAIAAACSDAGREPIPFSLMTGCVVGRTRAELAGRAEALLARRDDLGVDSVDTFLADPPSGWIVGTVADAVAQLGAYRDAGLSRVMLQNLLHEDLDVLSLIGRELAPAVA